jgi:Zn-finger nucleic acid-binding protein
MEGEKDRFGEKMKLVERAKEDIYFAARDLELIAKLRAQLKKVAAPRPADRPLNCPKCKGRLESYSFMDFALDRCDQCGGVWLDPGELEGLLKKSSHSPLISFVERLLGDAEKRAKEKGKTA